MDHEVFSRISMKIQEASYRGTALRKQGNSVEVKSGLPQWAISAGFRSYTMYSNDILEAMYAPGQPTRQRMFAWIVRHSSGNQSEFAVLQVAGVGGMQKTVAWRIDIAAELNIVESVISEVLQAMEEEGWIRTDGKRIFLIAQPIIKARPNAGVQIPDGLPVPRFDEWWAASYPTRAAAYEQARTDWNAARQDWRNDLKEYGELVEKLIASTPSAESVPRNFVVQTEAHGPRTNPSRSEDSIIIGKELTSKLASYDASEQEQAGAQAAEDLRAGIGKLQDAGVWKRLGPPNAQTIANLIKLGTAAELQCFIASCWTDRKHFKTWGIVVSSAREELPALRADTANFAREIETHNERLKAKQESDLDGEIRDALLRSGAGAMYGAEDLADYELIMPEAVARVRARLREVASHAAAGGGQ